MQQDARRAQQLGQELSYATLAMQERAGKALAQVPGATMPDGSRPDPHPKAGSLAGAEGRAEGLACQGDSAIGGRADWAVAAKVAADAAAAGGPAVTVPALELHASDAQLLRNAMCAGEPSG